MTAQGVGGPTRTHARPGKLMLSQDQKGKWGLLSLQRVEEHTS